jgi:hypothetical protein
MRYEVIIGATPREALEQAVTFFGPGGEGLQLTTKRPDSLIFQGGGGHVAITAKARGQETVLDLETREWDVSVQKFMTRISRGQPRRPSFLYSTIPPRMASKPCSWDCTLTCPLHDIAAGRMFPPCQR